MKKFLLLAAVVALMLTIAVPAVAKQSDEKEPQGSSINQEQNAFIDQKSDGSSDAATVEFGNQNAAQAQYNNPAPQDQYDETGGSPGEMTSSEINQSQNAAIVQKSKGEGSENAASLTFGNQTAAQAQYNNSTDQDQGDDDPGDDEGTDDGSDDDSDDDD
jgi:hypothetical protein